MNAEAQPEVPLEEDDGIVIDSGDAEESEQPEDVGEETIAEPETAQEPAESEEDPQGEDHPDWYVQAINRQHKKFRDEERRRIEAEQRLRDIETKLPKDARPEIPDVPDYLAYSSDEEYSRAVRARDEAIKNAAEWDARQAAEQERAQEAEWRERQQVAAQTYQAVSTYTDRAKQSGIKTEELQVAGNAVAAAGMNDDVAGYILLDEQGPQITMHLAKNPHVIEQLRSMHPLQAVAYIATTVKQAATEKKPAPQPAPPPPETLDGGGAPPSEEGPEGATYE